MTVVVSWLHNGEVAGEFMRSVINVLNWDHQHSHHIFNGGYLPIPSGPNLVESRNLQARTFLTSDSEWLWIVDSDMTFEPDTLDRLLAEADPVERPIVGGLCFGRREDRYFPTLYVIDADDEGWIFDDFPDDGLVGVPPPDRLATGAACLLIHRSVLEKMADHYPEPYPWFDNEIGANGGPRSEDIVFCLRAGELGFPVFVHTGIKTGHVKRYVITEAAYRSQR